MLCFVQIMCGIVGYIGVQDALPFLLSSLEQVTYRGYDSFGVAVLNGHGIDLEKQVGMVDQYRHQARPMSGTVGIGHTRWATVGGVSRPNAHPHFDCGKNLAIVHNGDIDNFRELRRKLVAAGHVFRSETDSEVIAHLIEEHGGLGVLEGVRAAVKELEGSYAMVVLDARARRLVVARRESPLVLGIGDGAVAVASDVPALLHYTDRIVYLEDGDLGVLEESEVSLWHGDDRVERPVHRVSWTAAQLGKGGHEHFMLKEIHEQPQAVRDTLAAHRDQVALSHLSPIGTEGDVLFIGCGTSYHAALLGARLIDQLTPLRASAQVASEIDRDLWITRRPYAVALSQSGETADTLSALRSAKVAGADTLAITNVLESSLARLAGGTIYTHAGPEVAVAATKTFMAQVTATYLLAAAWSRHCAHQSSDGLLASLSKLPGALRNLLSDTTPFENSGKALGGYEQLFIIAKGINVPVAMEGALKFKEVAYQYTEGSPAGELKHGPFALLGSHTPVIALVPLDEHHTRMLTALNEIRARGSYVVALAEEGDSEISMCADDVLTVPHVDPLLSPLLNTVVLQLLSYYSARERGCPIDRPRNLAKSVTVH